MGIQVGDNFDHKSKKPLDNRTSYATLAAMKAVTDANIPEGCFAYCEETDKYYKFLSTNTVDADTGKWREFEAGGGGTDDYSDLNNKPSINNVELSGNKSSSDLGLASKENMDKAYKSDDTAFTDIADGDYIPVYDTSATTKKKSLWSNIKAKLKTYFDTIYDLNKADIPYYGQCTDNSSTTAKTVTVQRGTFNLVAGAKVSVRFINANTASAPTLNVGSTGAKNIKYIDSDGTVTTPTTWWGAGDVVTFVYDGTQWLMMPTLGTMPSIPAIGTINRSDIFTTTEKVIGCWTDGRPLYQKTINFGALPNATSKSISHGISNLRNVIDIKAWCSAGTGNSVHSIIPYVFVNDASKDIRIQIQDGNIVITAYVDKSSLTNCFVTLQYTKTTDSANSYNYANENDYSTSEKIVGTWIDGKPIYQKTWQCSTASASSMTQGVTYTETPMNVQVETTISVKGIMITTGQHMDLPNTDNTFDAKIKLAIYPNSRTQAGAQNKIFINLSTNATSYADQTVYVTVQYTKV